MLDTIRMLTNAGWTIILAPPSLRYGTGDDTITVKARDGHTVCNWEGPNTQMEAALFSLVQGLLRLANREQDTAAAIKKPVSNVAVRT